jgi:hypothetical protein
MRWNGIRLVERRGFSMEDAKLYAEAPENIGIDDCFFYHIVAHRVKGSALHPRLQKDILQSRSAHRVSPGAFLSESGSQLP